MIQITTNIYELIVKLRRFKCLINYLDFNPIKILQVSY